MRPVPAPPASAGSIPKWLRYLGLVLAGCASFTTAVYFSSASNDDNTIQTSGQRHRVPAFKKADVGAIASNGVVDKTNEGPLFADTDNDKGNDTISGGGPSRLSPIVLKSPFDALNISASIDAPAPSVGIVNEKGPLKSTEPVPFVGPEFVPPPPPPVAPSLPFSVIGSIQGARIGDGAKTAFLSQNGSLLVVRAADVIGGMYRVENITDKAIEFTYLPLKQKQLLPVPK